MLTRLEDKEVAQNIKDSEDKWNQWVSKALKKGASKAHAWSNKHNQRTAQIKVAGLATP